MESLKFSVFSSRSLLSTDAFILLVLLIEDFGDLGSAANEFDLFIGDSSLVGDDLSGDLLLSPRA